METKFRFNAKEAYLTYPRCDLGKQTVFDHLIKLGAQEVMVSQEHHEDGGLHLHAYVCFEKKKDWRDFHEKFDCQGRNANNVTRKDGKTKYAKQDWLTYLIKEDKEPMANFDYLAQLEAMKNHKRGPQQKNLELLTAIEEKGLPALVKEGMVSIMNYKKVKQNYEEFKEDVKVDPREDISSRIETPWGEYMDLDVDVKKTHYWFYSTCPSLGKTTFALELSKKYRAEFYNYSELPKFNPLPVSTEMIILDEFRGQMKISELNMMCDGTLMFGAKGKTGWKLNQKPFVMVLSNKTPQEVYKNSDISLIEARFNIFDITSKKL